MPKTNFLTVAALSVVLMLGALLQPLFAAQSLSHDDRVAYVTKMGLIQGHLWVAAALVEGGHMALGAKHAKHPGQEVYQDLQPYFAATGAPGFALELQAMSDQLAADSGASVHHAYERVMASINQLVEAQNLSGLEKLQVALALVTQAEIEYRAGIQQGAVVDVKEYQDARGFVEIAQGLVASWQVARDQDAKSKAGLLRKLSQVKQLWPNLVPKTERLSDGAELASLVEALQAAVQELS
jgi:hypothetical protein